MSFDIGSVGVAPTERVTGAGGDGAHRAEPVQAPAGDAVKVDTFPASPPPQVRQEMATAAGVYDRLQEAGHQLSFQIDEHSGKLRIEVHDLDGHVLFTVPPAKALDVAAGGSLTD
jgi:hypothetical protein